MAAAFSGWVTQAWRSKKVTLSFALELHLLRLSCARYLACHGVLSSNSEALPPGMCREPPACDPIRNRSIRLMRVDTIGEGVRNGSGKDGAGEVSPHAGSM